MVMPAVPTDESRKQIRLLALAGNTDDTIARVMSCSEAFLKKHYAPVLAEARVTANANIAGRLYQTAMSGNVAAMIFWCKTRLRWKEVHAVEHTGENGEPLRASVSIICEYPKLPPATSTRETE